MIRARAHPVAAHVSRRIGRRAAGPNISHLTSDISHRPAFTLAELLVATIMLSMLVGATYIAVSQTIRARDRSQSKADAYSRAAAAADLISTDTQSALRDADLTDCRVLITRDGKPGQGKDGLLIFSHLTRAVRPNSGQNEGEEAEVQFRLEPGDKPGTLALWRRTDPVPDEYPDAGGVATALVDGVKAVDIQAYDGTSWIDDWDSDISGLPYALRISVTGADDSAKDTSTIRRVVAFDRIPLPSEFEALEDAAQVAAEAAANALNNQTSGQTNTGNTNTNQNNTGNLGNGGGGGGGRGNRGGNQGNGQGGNQGGRVNQNGNGGGGNAGRGQGGNQGGNPGGGGGRGGGGAGGGGGGAGGGAR